MIEKFQKLLEEAKTVAVVAHIRPDADSLGSASALYSYCLQLHKKVVFVCSTQEVQKQYRCIPWVEKIRDTLPTNVDLAIVCDCATKQRVGFELECPTVNIDHHKSNTSFATINIIDPLAISTTKVVYDIFQKLQVKINKKMATALYAGLVEDSECFTSSMVDGMVFAFAQALVEDGANHQEVMQYLQKYSTLSHQRLLGKMLLEMELLANATIAVHKVPFSLLASYGADLKDCEEALENSMKLPTVTTAILVVEKENGDFKVSLRSKSVDLNKIAATFGGGGHTSRAGCEFDSSYDMEQIVKQIVKKVKEIEKKK
jgi:phosphoesterase RecJ-like protein